MKLLFILALMMPSAQAHFQCKFAKDKRNTVMLVPFSDQGRGLILSRGAKDPWSLIAPSAYLGVAQDGFILSSRLQAKDIDWAKVKGCYFVPKQLGINVSVMREKKPNGKWLGEYQAFQQVLIDPAQPNCQTPRYVRPAALPLTCEEF